MRRRSRLRRSSAVVVSLAVLAGGFWTIGVGWDLRDIHANAEAARQRGAPVPGEVIGRDRTAGVELDHVRFTVGTIEVEARVVSPSERAEPGDEVHVRAVTPETAAYHEVPLFAADLVRGVDDRELAAVGTRARLLLWVGFAVTVLAAFAASAALYIAWPEPKKQTTPHVDRHGT